LTASRHSERRAGYLFVAPLVVVFVAFYVWPAIQTIVGSFFEWDLLNPWEPTDPDSWEFVGVDNYTATLTDDAFWNAAVNTLVWLVLFPAFVVAAALLFALLLWNVRRGAGTFRSVFILPMTISLAATGVIWSFMYNPNPSIGVLNAILDGVGLLDRHAAVGPLGLTVGAWLSDPGHLDLWFADIRLINVALVIPAFWAFTGFGVITITAGLTSVPDELVEAARVDGATKGQVVRKVLIPLLRGPIVVVGVVSVIFALRTFDIVYVMTGGGPADDSEVLALLLWKQAFAFLESPQAGRAAAIAVLMSAVLVLISWRYLRDMTRRSSR
jgi:ABC-type sugar transport system permease subunit